MKSYSRLLDWRYFFLLLIFGAILVPIFFYGIPSESFLFIHDEYLPLSNYEVRDQFYIHNFLDFGISNTIPLLVTFFDRIYYTLTYIFGLDLLDSQFLLYFLKLVIILLLPYFGFLRLSRLYVNNPNEFIVFAVSLWYSLNTYTLIYWHGNAFSLTLLICYALAPLTLFFWEVTFFSETNFKLRNIKKNQIGYFILALMLFLMSFALYFFLPFIILIAMYTMTRIFLGKENFIQIMKRLLLLCVICIPLFAIHLMIFYEMFFLSIDSKNTSGSATYGNISGGLLYIAMMWFTWPIYIGWTPRNIYTFNDYFRMPLSLMAPFVLYGIIIIGIILSRNNIRIIIFFMLFLFFWFFAKGAQQPLGEIYLFMLEHLPGFRIFRSPDTKFAFSIVLSISVLLILAGGVIKSGYSKYVGVLVLSVAIVQSWPLLTAKAIQGENTKDSYDRVIDIPIEYRDLADYMNEGERTWGYIITSPRHEFGAYQLSDTDQHLGQDLLPKIIQLPFVYASASSGMGRVAYEKFINAFNKGNYDQLSQFSIRYYIFRNDMKKDLNELLLHDYAMKELMLKFENSFFKVYEDMNASPLVEAKNISFKLENPSKINIKLLAHEQTDELVLHQNFHPGWRLYIDTSIISAGKTRNLIEGWIENISYLWKQQVPKAKTNGASVYGNKWNISEKNIQLETNINSHQLTSDVPLSLTLFHWSQALFYLLTSVSFFTASTYLAIICFMSNISRRVSKGKQMYD